MAESYFSIITPFDALNMDATLTVSRTLTSGVTDFPVEDGGFASDNIVNKGDVLTFSGVITDIKSLGGSDNGSTISYIRQIESIRNNKQLVTINVGTDGTSFNTITGCVLTNVSFRQDAENGISSRSISSYKVSLTFKKIRIISSAKVSTKDVAVPLRDSLTDADGSKDVTNKQMRVGNLGSINPDDGSFTRYDFTKGTFNEDGEFFIFTDQ
jgi:hypothetical protein